jgi:glycosyltransferase involved in cell wall biosynthesis
MLNLARALCQAGHAVTVLTMRTPKHPLHSDQEAQYSSVMPVHSRFVDNRVYFVPLLLNLLFSKLPYMVRRYWSPSFNKALEDILTSGDFDLVQLESIYLTPYIQTIRKCTLALIALRAHNVEHIIWKRLAKTERHPLKKFYLRNMADRICQFEHHAIHHYDCLLPITPLDSDHFQRMGNTKPIFVCPAGFDTESLYSDQIHVSDVTDLFFLGALDWTPNQEGIIWFIKRVFPNLLIRNPDLTLHIAGRNAPARLISACNAPGILFHGQIDDAKAFMQSHGIMVVPCFAGSGVRIKIIESLACGRPVVTTPVGAEGLAKTLERYLTLASTAEAFISGIEKLLQETDLRQLIADQAPRDVRAVYDSRRIGESLATFYKALMP